MNRNAVAFILLVFVLVTAGVTIKVLSTSNSPSDPKTELETEPELRLLVQSATALKDGGSERALPSGVKLLQSFECQNRAYSMDLYALDEGSAQLGTTWLRAGEEGALFRDGRIEQKFGELGDAAFAQPNYALLRYGSHPAQREQMELDWAAWSEDARVNARQVNSSPDVPVDGNPMVIQLEPTSSSSMLEVFLLSRGCFPD